jgi:glycyl-tRNA synthetase beta chain
MPDFLLELRSEEIPARMQRQAAADLERLFAAELAGAGLKATRIETFVTPRRLALIARGLPAETEAVAEELKGPRTSAPAQALDGFLRKTGLTQGELVERDGVWFAVIETVGRRTADVLGPAVEAVVRGFPWPKSMRWGAASRSTESLRWVRPLSGIVALFDGAVVPVEIGGVRSGRVTMGHRFMSAGEIVIDGADDYAAKLRAAKVIVSSAEREAIIIEGARKAAADAGLALVEDAALAVENAGLTEWPVPLLGTFDPAFLDVPAEVIQLTAAKNQKYFVCKDKAGGLAPAFVCVANIGAADRGTAIIEGNRKVLAARLADARFFFEQDRKKTLAEHAEKLKDIVFHEKLGTVADKVERVAKLARWLADDGIVTGADPDLAEQAARLAKADLATGMVGEFPELQGVMGGHYARAEGLPDAVADAIRDHYKPVGQGDEVPTAPVTVAVSLADKAHSLARFFSIGERPTGSKDPFALRRTANGLIKLIIENNIRIKLLINFRAINAYYTPYYDDKRPQFSEVERHLRGQEQNATVRAALEAIESQRRSENEAEFSQAFPGLWMVADEIMAFIADRLKVQQREAGVRHDLIDAVFALGQETGKPEDDLVRLLARVKALQGFIGTDDGRNLHAGYKRAANILAAEAKKAALPDAPATLPYAPEPAEAALIAALDVAEPTAAAAVEREDFEGAMAVLASLRAPIDAFFDAVTVNETDPAKRACRLALLARVRAAVHRVADFSKIEG